MKKIFLSLLLFFLIQGIAFPYQDTSVYHFLVGKILIEEGAFEKGVKEYEIAYQFDSESLYLKEELLNFYNILAQVYLQQDEIGKAKQYFQKTLELEGNNLEALYSLGVISIEEKEWEKAVFYLEKIKETGVEFEDLYFYSGLAYYYQNDYKKARDEFFNLLKKEKADPTAWYFIGRTYELEGNLDEAIKSYKKSLKYDSENIDSLFSLAVCYDQKKQYELAYSTLEKIIKINPDYSPALNYLGYSWAERGINLEQALIYIQKAVELEPNNAAYIDSLGWVYYQQGKYQLALKYLWEAIKLLPDDPEICEHLGDVYLKLGNNVESLKWYEKALQLSENNSELKSKIKNVFESPGKD